jgi:hypothetical protein
MINPQNAWPLVDCNNLEFHELADLFPLLQGEELQKIADDIKDNGFRPEPITLLDGKILDGRNRYNAAKLAEHELGPDDVVHFEEHYPGQDPLLFVVAKNLHRRHLTVGQRACLAAELYKRMAKRPVGQPKELSGIPDNTPTARESLKKAAEVAGVSVDSAQQVLHIEKVAPDLAAAVKAGNKSVNEASQEAKRRSSRGRGTLARWFSCNPLWAKKEPQWRNSQLVNHPGLDIDADFDQLLIEASYDSLERRAENLKKQFFALVRASEEMIKLKAQWRNKQLLNHVFDRNFRCYSLPRIMRTINFLVDPSYTDLADDLYIQLREVERCLDRYPDQLSGAVMGLLVLIRRYNPELAWTYPFSPCDNTPTAEERTCESDHF